ncbi:MAG: thioredoxin-disulfide reductase [Firmicutes bacterium]|nr:thioredoxin-disulfide reductase [Bacillota bacterium]
MSHDELFDVVIIGGGPAGLTAGLYASRARLKCVLLEAKIPGGQLLVTEKIENYPGRTEQIEGQALAREMLDQARKFGLDVRSHERIKRLAVEGEEKLVETEKGVLRARTVIVATGSEPRRLKVPGEGKYLGRGVSYCAVCDGAFFEDLDVAVVGGGDAAVEEALYLAKIAAKVTIIHRRDELRATRYIQERAFATPNMEFLWNSVVESITGDDLVTDLTVKNVKTGEVSNLKVNAVFVYVGTDPNTDFLPPEIKLDPQGYILVDDKMETSVPGIFAAGDIRSKIVRQVATAVGDGCIAINAVEKYLLA